jgi:hypothetical protein
MDEKHLATETRCNLGVSDGGDVVGFADVVGIELGGDTPDTVRVLRIGRSGHGTPPLVGNCTAGEDSNESTGANDLDED